MRIAFGAFEYFDCSVRGYTQLHTGARCQLFHKEQRVSYSHRVIFPRQLRGYPYAGSGLSCLPGSFIFPCAEGMFARKDIRVFDHGHITIVPHRPASFLRIV